MSQKVPVVLVPTEGNPVEHQVDYREGMSVQDALDAAGVAGSKKNVTVAREEVVAAKDFGTRKLAPGEKVTVTERPRGS